MSIGTGANHEQEDQQQGLEVEERRLQTDQPPRFFIISRSGFQIHHIRDDLQDVLLRWSCLVVELTCLI